MAIAPVAPVRARLALIQTVIEVTSDTGQEIPVGRRMNHVYPAPREPMRAPARPSWGSLFPPFVTTDASVGFA